MDHDLSLHQYTILLVCFHKSMMLRSSFTFWATCALLLLTATVGVTGICLNETHRPQYHFSPAANWLNDPNGMVYWFGEYHLYYQYHPESSRWGPMHWGHTISTDLVHWTELPIAIYPDPELGDIFSGSAVVDHFNMSGFQAPDEPAPIVAIYTHAGAIQTQSVSFSNDRGRTFESYALNPVLPNQDPWIPDYRDPKVVEYEPQHWVMVLAAGQEIIFYDTRDLKRWTETGRFGGSPPEGSHGGVWECPDLLRFTVDGVVYWVLLVSINPGGPNGGSATQYFIGDFDGRTFRSFTQERLQWLDYGPDNYAGVTFANENRRIYMGWMNNWNYANDLPTAPGEFGGWRGQMTIPRQLDLVFVDGRLKLRSRPVPELNGLRDLDQTVDLPLPITIIPDNSFPLFDVVPFRNDLLEVDLLFNLAGLHPEAAFVTCFFNSRRQEFCVTYERGPNGGRVHLDRGQSGNIDFSGAFNARSTADRQTNSNTMSLKLFVDRSSAEVFVDGGLSTLTGLFYPDEPFLEANITLFSPDSGSRLVLESATVWGLKSIYDC